MNAARPPNDSILRQTLDAQVNTELETRAGTPKLDFDRLRMMKPLILDKLSSFNTSTVVLDAMRKRAAAEYVVLVGATQAQFAVVERMHQAWVSAAAPAQVWSAETVTFAGELSEVARDVRRIVSDRLSEENERDADIRKRVGVGTELARSTPLAVVDFVGAQLGVLQEPECAAQLVSLGLDVDVFVFELTKGLKRLQAEMATGPGQRRGEARVARDREQRRLEILLSRATAKVHAVFGAKASAAFEALLPRPAVRRPGDVVVEPEPVVDAAPVVPVMPVMPAMPVVAAPPAVPSVPVGPVVSAPV